MKEKDAVGFGIEKELGFGMEKDGLTVVGRAVETPVGRVKEKDAVGLPVGRVKLKDAVGFGMLTVGTVGFGVPLGRVKVGMGRDREVGSCATGAESTRPLEISVS